MRLYLSLVAIMITGAVTAQPKNIRQWANQDVLAAKALTGAHVGISIMDPATGKYWIQYQDDKFFMPASNTKIFTLFTGLQILGDSLPGMRITENDTAVFIQGTADPSFLHPDFSNQPVKDLLTQTNKRIWYQSAVIKNKRFGPGWAWSDYADYYQPELNEWPMYGNVARIKMQGNSYTMVPAYPTRSGERLPDEVLADREERENEFVLHFRPEDKAAHDFEVPFITGGNEELIHRLQDTLHKEIGLQNNRTPSTGSIFRSIPADTLFQPMMHRSDNFFAEQILMMCASQKWDTIDTRKTIAYMLDSTLKDLPHPPSWVDGSGLSRYNLFTPRDFVTVLEKLYKKYPKERLYPLFPTGGKGTLRNYYQALPGRLYAKTGTLSGCVALSGFLVTKAGKTLIFSILVNNHNSTATAVRRAVEEFLVKVANN